jgi:hypothetical protein
MSALLHPLNHVLVITIPSRHSQDASFFSFSYPSCASSISYGFLLLKHPIMSLDLLLPFDQAD